MNKNYTHAPNEIQEQQLTQFREIIAKLFQCCQERMQYQSDRFGLPEAELRCLMLFGNERYLTPKGIAHRMNVVKSRVSKVVQGLVKRELVQKIDDPTDSRIKLISLTPEGHKKWHEINSFINDIHSEVLVRMVPDQRNTLMANLDILAASMESIKTLLV